MSSEHPSRARENPFADPTLPTLQDVLDWIAKEPALTGQQRTERASAVRTVARAIALPLTAIPAHPAFLGKKLAAVNHARIGLKPASWANAKSLLNKTLRERGMEIMPGRYLAPISEDWQPLWQPLPERPYKIALSRFIRFSSTQGVAPTEVTESVFEAFETALRDESFVKAPYTVARDARRFWNEAGNLVPDWPRLRVAIHDRRARYQVALSAFPGSFAQELAAYGAVLARDVLDLESGTRPIKPVSAEFKIKALHRLASAAVANGMAPTEIPDLRSLVRPEVVRRGLRFVRDRNGKDKLKSFDTLLAHVISTARHWVKAPDCEIEELVKLKRALDIDTYEMSETTNRVLRDLDRREMLRALILLPERVFEETLHRPELKRSACVRVQVALAIAILICAPLRSKNLAALHLERHLIDVGVGRKRHRHLRVPGTEVKNGEDLEYPLPDRVTALLDRYLDEVRPRIATPGNLFLFPGEGAGPKNAPLLSAQIATLTEALLGVRMTAHKFRAVAGKVILDRNPTGQEIVRQVLGHRDIKTTSTYYAPLERDRAIALYDEAIRAATNVSGEDR